MIVLPIGTSREAETLESISPVATHCPPPEDMKMFMRPESSQHIAGQEKAVAFAAIALAMTVARLGPPGVTTVYYIKPMIPA
jgi:hypothetical protein